MEIIQINPLNNKFSFVLTKDTCFRLKTGLCSLSLSDEDTERFKELSINQTRGSVDYCRKLFKEILENGFQEHVQLVSNNCNHYGFSDGQHRVCIAKEKIIDSVPATIGKGRNFCTTCSESPVSFIR